MHAISLVNQNISWYLLNGVVSSEAATKLEVQQQQAVKDLVPHMNNTLEGLGCLKVPAMYGPIARDYVAFNA